MSPPSKIDWRSIPNACDTTPFFKNKGLLQLSFFASILFMSETLCGFDGTIIGGLQALPAWQADLGHPSAAKIGLLNGISFITGTLVGPINSYMCDNWGRKWPIRLSGFTMLIGTILGVCAGIKSGTSGFALFLVSKAVIGFGMQAGLATSIIMMQEIWHPRTRAQVSAAWDCTWVVGNIIASFTVFGTSRISSSWSWRLPYLIQLLPAFYIVIALQFVPETPRFLLSKGRVEEARAFLVKYHGNGDENDEMVKWEFEEMSETLALEAETQESSWSAILKHKGNKRRFILAGLMTIMPQLNGSSIISFYYTVILNLVGITGATTQTGINAGLNVFGFFCSLVGVWALKYVPRRAMVLYTWPVLGVFMAVIMGTSAVFANTGSNNRGLGLATVVFVWLFSGLNQFIGPLFYSYPAEVQNYQTRAKGMAVWTTANQLSGCFSSFVNSIALNAIGWKWYGFYLPVIAVQWVAAYIFMVETKGYSLEEVAMAFEGMDAAVAKVDEKLAVKAYVAEVSSDKESLEV